MTVKQTKCPFCHSMFYITPAQLSAYHGHVRCGQCQQIFDASANLVISPIEPTNKQKVASDEIQTPDNPIQTSIAANAEKKDSTVMPSESLANSSSPSTSIPLNDVFDRDFLEAQLALSASGSLETKHNLYKPEETRRKEADDLVEKIMAVQPHESSRSSQAKIKRHRNSSIITEHEENLLSYLQRSGVATISSDPTAEDAYFSKPAQHRILQPTQKQVHKGHFLAWSMLCILMLVLLCAQYVYFHFDKLTYDPRTRDYMASLCNVLQCNIPYMNAQELALKDIRLISTGNNETTFKIKMINQATLSQPFPALRLSLHRHGRVVASQIIQPRQYLPIELKTLSRMATKTPYEVSFTINRRKSEIEQYALSAEFN